MFRFFRRKSGGINQKLLDTEPEHPISEKKKEFLYIKYDTAEEKLKEVLSNWSRMKIRFVRKIDYYEDRMKEEQEKLSNEKSRLHRLYNKKINEIEKRSRVLRQKYDLMKEGYTKLTTIQNGEKEENKEEAEARKIEKKSGEEGHDVELEAIPEAEKEKKVEPLEISKQDGNEVKVEDEIKEENVENQQSAEHPLKTTIEEEEEIPKKDDISEGGQQQEKYSKKEMKKIEEEVEGLKKENVRLTKEAGEFLQKYTTVSKTLKKLEQEHEMLVKQKQDMETGFQVKVKKLLESKEKLRKEMMEEINNLRTDDDDPSTSSLPFPSLSNTSSSITTTIGSRSPLEIIVETSDRKVQTDGEIIQERKKLLEEEEENIYPKKKVETREKKCQAEINLPKKEQKEEEEKGVQVDIIMIKKEEEEEEKVSKVDEIIESPWGDNSISQEEKNNNNNDSDNEELQKLQELSKNQENAIFELTQKSKSLETELVNLGSTCSAQKEENKKLKDGKAEKERQVEEFEQKVKKLESDYSKAESKMKDLVEEYEHFKEGEASKFEKQRKDLERAKLLLENQKKEMDDKPEIPMEVQMELDDLKLQIVQKEESVGKLKMGIQELNNRNSKLKREKKMIEYEMGKVKDQKSEVETILKSTSENLKNKEVELGEMKVRLAKFVAERKRLREAQKQNCNTLVQKQKDLEGQVAALTKQASQLKKLGEDYQAQNLQLEKVSQDLAVKLKEVEQTRDESLEQNKVYEQEISKLMKEKEDLEERFDKFNEHNEKLKDDLQKMTQNSEESAAENRKLVKTMKTLEANTLKYKDLLQKSEIQRKKLHNIIEDSKGKIRVYMRCRPMSRTENERKCENVINFESPFAISVNDISRNTVRHYDFTKSFSPSSTQEQVYGDTKDLILSAVDGYNVCIFAYGQTGSGKTYTISGEKPNAIGIVDRGINDIFRTVKRKKKMYRFQIECYMVELYLDKVFDLFAPKKNKNNVKYDIKKNVLGQVVVTNVVRKRVKSAEECLRVYEEGLKNRHTRSTDMNDVSSRSHLIFSVLIIANNPTKKTTTYGKLSLVDLAGSERIKKTNITDAIGLKEGMAINTSLSALGNVINALSLKKKFVPYRDDKLTLLLSDSIGGTAKTLMFVCVSPADYNVEETCNSLLYANRAKTIVNKVEQQNETSLNKKYRMQIELLRESLQQKCDSSEEYDVILEQILTSIQPQKRGSTTSQQQQQQQQPQNKGEKKNSLAVSAARTVRSKTPQPRKGKKAVLTTPRRSRTPRK